MQQYLEKVRELLKQFKTWKVIQIPREENAEVDALANLGSVADVSNEKNAIVVHLFHLTLDQTKNEPIIPSTNKIIVNNLKKRLEESKVKWPKVLPRVLWAYRTTTKISTGETPFLLVYGTEALISVEIGEPSTWYMYTNEASNQEELRTNLDLIEERRETALVFRSTHAANAGKLSPNWEGKYRIIGITGNGAYELDTMDDKVLPYHWNAVHLKRYYF
uniref:Uncharacterized protein LOC104210972 n=1 Tax=Nicotiana sylvestris TaxID=4096 RepID=A0A1U7UQ72_NICSY|nr:PREDICTED: uncharacterized protein LOC104210972 [Nicotiana sylvestris]